MSARLAMMDVADWGSCESVPGSRGMFGKDYSAGGTPLGLGRPNSTDCAPFSTTIERKPIPRINQPSFCCPTRSSGYRFGVGALKHRDARLPADDRPDQRKQRPLRRRRRKGLVLWRRCDNRGGHDRRSARGRKQRPVARRGQCAQRNCPQRVAGSRRRVGPRREPRS